MPTIGTNYALNPHFTNPDPPTLGWTKYRIDGYPYHYVEFFGGPRWGCAPDNWCNTIGVETVGGSNRLDSTTNDVPGFVPTLIDSVTISQFIDWEPTITNWARTESTPGASAFCGCNYTHGGQGFPMAPGEIWRLRFTVKLLSPAPSHRIRGRIGWGSRAIANDPVWGLGCSQFSPVTFFGQGVYPHVYFDQFFDGDPDVDWDTVGEEHTIDCLFTVDNFWFGGATIAGIEYLNYWTPVLDTTTARFDLSIGFECLPFTYVGDGIKFAILDPFELIYEGSLTVPPNYPGGPVADEPPDVTPPTPEPIVVDHEGLALCGEFEGEVLMDGTDYVGVYGFNTGMAADLWNDYCEGGLTWLYSNWWLAPCHHGAVCPDWPINLFASFLPGVYPAITYDTTGPPGLEDSPAFSITGSGLNFLGIAFWPMTTPWEPPLGSCWTMEGWVKTDIPDPITISVGFATENWGYSASTAAHTSPGWTYFKRDFTTFASWSVPIYEDNPKIPVIAIYGGSSLSNSETRDITYPCPCASGCQHITMNKAYPYGEFLFKCVHLYPCGAGPPEPPELQDGVLLTPQSL